MLELDISPRALVADLKQFEPGEQRADEPAEDLHDPLLELLRRGALLQQDDFLSELHQQRNPEAVHSA
jgi:hypothetical protein